MKRSIYLLVAVLTLASCGGKKGAKGTGNTDSTEKATPVSVMEIQPTDFTSYINVQSQVVCEENVYATTQAAGGVVKKILVHLGDHVSEGQTLAILDASTLDQQIKAQEAQVDLLKTLYEKQQKLWSQNIGTQVQLLQSKTAYESALSQKEALVAQRRMTNITSPISGVVDKMDLKVGDAVSMVSQAIRIVNLDKLKAEANLGEGYLGKVHTGDKVVLALPDINDSIITNLTYVSQAVDPISRAFLVQVRLASNKKLHPNMSCIMKIANYENKSAFVVPVSAIQKTSEGSMLYVIDGNKAKSVIVQTGHTSNGHVEITAGLNAGDKVVTVGYENLDNGQPVVIE